MVAEVLVEEGWIQLSKRLLGDAQVRNQSLGFGNISVGASQRRRDGSIASPSKHIAMMSLKLAMKGPP